MAGLDGPGLDFLEGDDLASGGRADLEKVADQMTGALDLRRVQLPPFETPGLVCPKDREARLRMLSGLGRQPGPVPNI